MEELAGATAVFSGRVTAISRERARYSYQRVTFQVEQRWKGAVADETVIFTGSGGGDCGYNFVQGAEYLVYAYDSGGEFRPAGLQTGICLRTRPLSNAAEDLRDLGPGTPVSGPVPSQMPNVGDGRGAILPPLVAAGVAAMVLAGTAFRLWNRMLRRRMY